MVLAQLLLKGVHGQGLFFDKRHAEVQENSMLILECCCAAHEVSGEAVYATGVPSAFHEEQVRRESVCEGSYGAATHRGAAIPYLHFSSLACCGTTANSWFKASVAIALELLH